MNKEQTLSHTTGRVSFKELQQIIKMIALCQVSKVDQQ